MLLEIVQYRTKSLEVCQNHIEPNIERCRQRFTVDVITRLLLRVEGAHLGVGTKQ